MFLFLYFVICCVHCCAFASVSWKPDNFTFLATTVTTSPAIWNTVLTIDSNGPLYVDKPESNAEGHLRLNITVRSDSTRTIYNGISGCMSINSKALGIASTVSSVRMSKFGMFTSDGQDELIAYNYDVPLSDLVVTRATAATQETGSSVQTLFRLVFTKRDPAVTSLDLTIGAEQCAPARTVGAWDDPSRWREGRVPTANDSVVFPLGSGVIVLSRDVAVGVLNVSAGSIVAHSTSCPEGWSVDPVGAVGSKCYQLNLDRKSFDSAEAHCRSRGLSSADAHLVQIRDRAEQLSAARLCRGSPGSGPRVSGCWIGMRDASGTGQFDWVAPHYVGGPAGSALFLDWRRGEPNNHTVSEGAPTNGERCVQLSGWQDDPLAEEQGTWNDDSCALAKPFICQIYGRTVRHTITVDRAAHLAAGAMEGGLLVLGRGPSAIDDFSVSRGGSVRLGNESAGSAIHTLMLIDGSTLRTDAPVLLTGGGFVGEPLSSAATATQMQPLVVVSRSLTLTGPGNATINAGLAVAGQLVVEGDAGLSLLQGGDLSLAVVSLARSAAQLTLAGYATRCSAYDAFELRVSNRGPFLGEYFGEVAREQDNMHRLAVAGVYRLRVSQSAVSNRQPSLSSVTQCVPYNATDTEMAALLNELQLVRSRGGASVRRVGDQTSARHAFGFAYRIEMAAPDSDRFELLPLGLALDCYGTSATCGCANTKVPLVDENGNAQCPSDTGQLSQADPSACVHPPVLEVTRISSLSFLGTHGDGRILISGGAHRLPPVSAVIVHAVAGSGFVAADNITWRGISATQSGRMVLMGAGWDAWDSGQVLYAPDWTTRRGLVSALSRSPPFVMHSEHLAVGGLGSILSAAPLSNVTLKTGVWAGGTLGGRSTFSVTSHLSATDGNKSLRFGATLFVQEGARMDWRGGNISLADGADFILEGLLRVNATATEVFIGESQLFAAPPPEDLAGRELLTEAAGRDFHGYYGDELVAELRGGWYQNPLCGDQCLLTSHLVARRSAVVECTDHTKVTFLLPLDLVEQSSLRIGEAVGITIASGGTCGNEVVIDIGANTTLALSGGRMSMEAFCTIRGEGELIVSAGAHDSAFSIDAHITISGGTLLWPLSRGTNGELTFKGGLLLDRTGELSVEPFSTRITVHKEVVMRDQSVVRFPLIGIAAQASPFDAQDAPDTSPRGRFNAKGVMRWEGGTIVGKADFNSEQALFLDGQAKYVRSLAKLVNLGRCEWGSGDLVMDDQGDFLNLGTVQMVGAQAASFRSSAMYLGTELPVETGGDAFALSYHSYDMDIGGLSYGDYVRLRTQFVSRAPNDWSPEDQGRRRVVLE